MLMPLYVTTTYRDNFELFDVFVSFYLNYWNVDKLFLMIGLTDKTNISNILSLISHFDLIEFKKQRNIKYELKSGSSIVIEHSIYYGKKIACVFYKTPTFEYNSDWNHFRYKLCFRFIKQCRFCDNELDQNFKKKNAKNILIDHDEFYFIPNMISDNQRKNHILYLCQKEEPTQFHCLEYIPKKIFSFDQDWDFTISGMGTTITEDKSINHTYCKNLSYEKPFPRNKHCNMKMGQGDCLCFNNNNITKDDIKSKYFYFHLPTIDFNNYKWRLNKYAKPINAYDKENNEFTQEGYFYKYIIDNPLYNDYKINCNWFRDFLITSLQTIYYNQLKAKIHILLYNSRIIIQKANIFNYINYFMSLSGTNIDHILLYNTINNHLYQPYFNLIYEQNKNNFLHKIIKAVLVIQRFVKKYVLYTIPYIDDKLKTSDQQLFIKKKLVKKNKCKILKFIDKEKRRIQFIEKQNNQIENLLRTKLGDNDIDDLDKKYFKINDKHDDKSINDIIGFAKNEPEKFIEKYSLYNYTKIIALLSSSTPVSNKNNSDSIVYI